MSDKVKQYFKDYKKSDEVHQTSDGFLFHQHHEAATHAKTLEDKTITKHERGVVKEDDAEAKAAAEKIAAEKKAEAEKEKAEKGAAKKEAAEKAKADKNKEKEETANAAKP